MLSFVRGIVVIGLGGIGTWLAPPLCRYLHDKRFGGDIVFADGDSFSELNLGRQDAGIDDIHKPKAQVMADRLQRCLPGLHLRAFNQYVAAGNVVDLIKDRSLVITAVDNHPARAVVARHAATLRDVCVLSAGNDKLDGNLHVYLRRGDVDETVPLIDRHPEIAKSRTGDRATLGCDELIALGETQLIATNFLAAAALLVAFHALWDRDSLRRSRHSRNLPVPQEVFFDIRSQAMACIPVRELAPAAPLIPVAAAT
jgi:molybdopterin/thiamine biosynthesis adenylyltransferase